LVLSGNPCARDQTAIQRLKKSSPRLQIITTSEETEGAEENEKVSKTKTKMMLTKQSLSLPLPETMASSDDVGASAGTEADHAGDDEPGEDEEVLSAFVIDPELVLREVVDRKCRLQALTEKVNIERLTKVFQSLALSLAPSLTIFSCRKWMMSMRRS
jgi:hypothetical protein